MFEVNKRIEEKHTEIKIKDRIKTNDQTKLKHINKKQNQCQKDNVCAAACQKGRGSVQILAKGKALMFSHFRWIKQKQCQV